MAKLILFSIPGPEVMAKIEPEMFSVPNPVMAYIPANGNNEKVAKYMAYWQNLAENNKAEFKLIDNSKPATNHDIEYFSKTNILVVTGGNTFTLLYNIKRNGFYDLIKQHINKKGNVYVGFSAGAILLTPTIRIAGYEWNGARDENNVELKNLEGMNIVDFEILPHFTERDRARLTGYIKRFEAKVQTIRDDEFIII